MSMNTSLSHNYVLDKIKDIKVGIITSQWNNDITSLLKNSCNNFLINTGLEKNNINNYYVPGSMELVLASDILLNKKNIDGVIALGCIIKGETKHDDYLSSSIINSIQIISHEYVIPIINGILTTNTLEQAIDRAGKKYRKGKEYALASIDMLALAKSLD